MKQLHPLAGWLFQGCQMFCLGHVTSVLLEVQTFSPLELPTGALGGFLYPPSTSYSQGSYRDWEQTGKGLGLSQPLLV